MRGLSYVTLLLTLFGISNVAIAQLLLGPQPFVRVNIVEPRTPLQPSSLSINASIPPAGTVAPTIPPPSTPTTTTTTTINPLPAGLVEFESGYEFQYPYQDNDPATQIVTSLDQVPSGDDITLSWESLAELPQNLGECAACSYEGRVLVVGQFEDNIEGPGFVYNILTNTWTITRTIVPDSANHVASVQQGSKCYLFGGFSNTNFNSLDTVRVFDFETGAFSVAEPIPFPSGSGIACKIGTNVFYMGGITGGKTTNQCAVFSTLTGTWGGINEGCSPMPIGVNHAAYADLDGVCYIVSGRQGDNSVSNGVPVFQIYNMITDVWDVKKLPEITSGRGGMGNAVIHDSNMYVFGGELPSGVEGVGKAPRNTLNLVDIIDLATGTWDVSVDDKITPRHGLCSVEYQGAAYVISGGENAGRGFSKKTEKVELL